MKADVPAWAAAVRARRRALTLTQQDLADLAGVGVRLVHEVERGRDTVTLSNLVGLLHVLGLHLSLRSGAATEIETGIDVPRSTDEAE